MKLNRISIIEGAENFQDRCDEVLGNISFDVIKSVVARLKDALYANKDVPALCAPQLGEQLRLFVVRNGNRDESRFKVFLNPMIISGKDLHMSREANPSFPGKEFIIPRKNEVHVAYQGVDGIPNSETFVGAYAEVVQQMIEMLDGITLFDYGLDLDDVGGAQAFDKATQKDKVAVISMYLDSLKARNEAFAAEIASNEKLRFINDDIELKKQYLLGNIKPLTEEERKVVPQ